MSKYSTLIFVGKVGKSPECDNEKVSFPIVTLRKANGEIHITEFVATSDGLKEFCFNNLEKGNLICVEGRPSQKFRGKFEAERVTFLR